MEITYVRDQKPAENVHNVDARKVYDKQSAQVVVMILHPGESLKPHKTPVDVFFYVLEGKGVVLIGDEEKVVEQDCVIHSPANIIHSWKNESNELLRILVVKIINPNSRR